MNFSTGWNLKRIKSCRILQIPNLSKSHPERSLRSLLPSHQIKSQGTLMKISLQQRTQNQAMLAPLQRKLLYKMRVLQQERKMKTFQSTSQSKNLKSLKKPAVNFLHSRGWKILKNKKISRTKKTLSKPIINLQNLVFLQLMWIHQKRTLNSFLKLTIWNLCLKKRPNLCCNLKRLSKSLHLKANSLLIFLMLTQMSSIMANLFAEKFLVQLCFWATLVNKIKLLLCKFLKRNLLIVMRFLANTIEKSFLSPMLMVQALSTQKLISIAGSLKTQFQRSFRSKLLSKLVQEWARSS